MPKLGRRNDAHQVQYMYPNASVTRNAPFGTGDTPQQRIKIIGSKSVVTREDGNYGTHWPSSPEPIASPTLSNSHGRGTPLKLSPLSHKPTNFNPHELQARIDRAGAQGTNQPNHQQHHQQYQPHQPQYQQHQPHQPQYQQHQPHQPPFQQNQPYHQQFQQQPQQQQPYQPQYQQQQPYHQQPNNAYQSQSLEANGFTNQQAPMNPRAVIPPIGTPSSEFRPAVVQHQAPPSQHQSTVPDLRRHLPRDGTHLPRVAVTLSKDEELELRRQIREDLQGYNPHRLKDVYMKLAKIDCELTGYVSYTDLIFAMLESQMALSAMTLRMITSLYIDDKVTTNLVNYEKILSFIDASLRNEKPGTVQEAKPQPIIDREDAQPKPAVYNNPITHESEEYSPRTKRFPYGAGDNAKLLRLIEEAILDSGEDLDFDKIRHNFGRADRGRRGMLSREQIKSIAYCSNIPLQDSILNRIIDKLDTSNGQYNWTQFIEYLEHVQPLNTGLKIPESKRPTEYVKHYPEPSTDWPQNKDELLPKQRGVFGTAASPEPIAQSPDGRSRHRVDRFNQLEQQHQQNKAINNVQREFQKLNSEYERVKKTDNPQSNQGAWFERFKKLADALYMNDLEKDGYLTMRETEWLVNNYNEILQLSIPSQRIQEVIQKHAENKNRVPIHKILETLGTQS